MDWVINYGLRIRNSDVMRGDLISKRVKSGAINYMRSEMTPLLDATGEE